MLLILSQNLSNEQRGDKEVEKKLRLSFDLGEERNDEPVFRKILLRSFLDARSYFREPLSFTRRSEVVCIQLTKEKLIIS